MRNLEGSVITHLKLHKIYKINSFNKIKKKAEGVFGLQTSDF